MFLEMNTAEQWLNFYIDENINEPTDLALYLAVLDPNVTLRQCLQFSYCMIGS